MPGRLILLGMGAVLLASAAAVPAALKTAYLPEDARAVLTPEMEIVVTARVLSGEGWEKLAARLLNRRDLWRELQKVNGGRARILKGQKVTIPFEWLRPDYKAAVLQGFFPQDGYFTDGWHHVLEGESLWHTAIWFTGSGKNYRKIRDRNDLPSLDVGPGQSILIPRELLWKDLRQRIKPEKLPTPQITNLMVSPPQKPPPPQLPPVEPAPAPGEVETPEVFGPPAPSLPATEPGPAPPPAATEQMPPSLGGEAGEELPSGVSFAQLLSQQGAGLQLQFDGEFAIYRLKRGEALYSSVVIRFTGVEEVQEVLRIAEEIARRSGVEDVTRIPAGYPLKIPKDLLLPQFLPKTSQERIAWEQQEKEVDKVKVEVFAPKLEGVHVILDAGHGGRDTGAVAGAAWESTYVYDIYSRVYNLLKESTRALVTPLVADQKSQFALVPSDRLPQHRRQMILTSPPQILGDPQTGVNLRWKLANMKMTDLSREGVDSRKVVFLSFHADALHPSIRGTMVYIPGARYCKALSGADAVRAEGYSKGLAEELIDTLYKNGLAIHPYQAVRNRIIRYRSYWVPAVLKMNYIPTKALIEVVNLNNPTDRAALQTQAYRQKFAESVVEALVRYFEPLNGEDRAADSPDRDGRDQPLSRKKSGRFEQGTHAP